jgi:DNA-binding HxlR family transcriptional regulator
MPTRTAEQRREQSVFEFNAFMASCPTRQVMATIGDKWAGLLVNALADGPRRHSQLAARIAGASQKMLTQTLRTLERDGLVTRTVTPSVPVRVDYELTDLGRTLLPVLRAVKHWSEAHISEIQSARDEYDRAVARRN